MRKTIVALVVLTQASLALASTSNLVGTWRSDDIASGNSKGTMVLKKNGEVDMQPDGFPVSSGHYKVQGAFLDVDLGEALGKASIAYRLEKGGKVLEAQYADGTRQTFNKVEKK